MEKGVCPSEGERTRRRRCGEAAIKSTIREVDLGRYQERRGGRQGGARRPKEMKGVRGKWIQEVGKTRGDIWNKK